MLDKAAFVKLERFFLDSPNGGLSVEGKPAPRLTVFLEFARAFLKCTSHKAGDEVYLAAGVIELAEEVLEAGEAKLLQWNELTNFFVEKVISLEKEEKQVANKFVSSKRRARTGRGHADRGLRGGLRRERQVPAALRRLEVGLGQAPPQLRHQQVSGLVVANM